MHRSVAGVVAKLGADVEKLVLVDGNFFNPITGGGGLDTRYTFSQPLADIYRSGTHGVSNLFNSFMGRSHSVSPNVSDQPYLA